MKRTIVLVLIFFFQFIKCIETITIAILAKDKAHTLPLFLQCIEQQTWPKNQTYLYIRTNNNNDETSKILKNWIEKIKKEYLQVYFDCSNVVENVEQYKQHEWNAVRFKVLGKIRQESIHWAKERDSHYFVVDCDNFIMPDTLETLFNTNLPVVAPFLRKTYDNYYSNYHAETDENGYYKDCDLYYQILFQRIKGLIEVPVVHCTYFIRKEFLNCAIYDDESYRYEYVVFSDWLRKQNVPQYLDNRKLYGRMTSAETAQEFENEIWLHEFKK